MNRVFNLWVFLLAMLTADAFAYEPETHRLLSGAAADASAITASNGSMADLGLKGITDTSQQFPNSNGVRNKGDAHLF